MSRRQRWTAIILGALWLMWALAVAHDLILLDAAMYAEARAVDRGR